MKVLTDYANRPVRLTDERLAHLSEHPEMVGVEARIAETLAHPQLVVQSSTDSSASLFYRQYLATIVGDKWLCVVVKYHKDDAFVVTAYLTDRPKKGTTQWPST